MESLNSTKKTVIYAPGIHLGGGLVLLESLIASRDKSQLSAVFLDVRLRDCFDVDKSIQIFWIKQSMLGRAISEVLLAGYCRGDTDVLCFHGLPPLLPNRGGVSIFFQNRILLSPAAIKLLGFRARLRCFAESILLRVMNRNKYRYFVHTESTKDELLGYLGGESKNSAKVVPLVGGSIKRHLYPRASTEYEFVYPAHGEAHKNHRRLIEAWRILASDGYYPTLALTLSDNNSQILKYIDSAVEDYGLKILNLGNLTHKEMLEVYSRSSALIFPSMVEAYGLPLMEAEAMNVPILAGELDFVRDICEPVETFDVLSAASMSRAVRRFLYPSENNHLPADSTEFWFAFDGPYHSSEKHIE